MARINQRSLEETPVWAVSVVCLVIIFISIFIEGSIDLLTKFLNRKQRKSLQQALEKIKTELMIMGFISLLLAGMQDLIVKICVTEAVENTFLPCEKPPESRETSVYAAHEITGSNKMLPSTSDVLSYCEAKEMISLISSDGIKQLRIFIFVLTVFHVLCCVLTMTLGIAKMRVWKSWEEETQTLDYEIENDPRRFRLTRQTSFGQRHLKLGSDHPLLLWAVSFFRQFSSSVTQADYFTLRNGFIVAHFSESSNFNFQKFLARAFDHDFVQVVGISFWIWIFSILFIFFSAHVFYDHFWLPFIPLLMVLAVGTKLQVIITKMCLKSRGKTTVVRGTMLVKPSDSLFWFNRPHWLLYLIHFILFQNSFQLAFFTWTWYEFGIRSCFHRTTVDISLSIAMGVIVQLLCGYVTLPLYALVTQMGSVMKEAVLGERVVKALKHWHSQSRHNLSRNRSLSIHSSESRGTHKREGSLSDVQEAMPKREDTLSDVQELSSAQNEQCPPFPFKNTTSDIAEEVVLHKNIGQGTHDGEIPVTTFSENGPHPSLPITDSTMTEITEEVLQHKIITGETHDGEISFRTSVEKDQPLPLSVTNSTKEIIAEEVRDMSIPRGTYDSGIVFRTSKENYQPQSILTMKFTKTKMAEDSLQHESIKRGTYDGEISFAASWKELDHEKEIEEITLAISETTSDTN